MLFKINGSFGIQAFRLFLTGMAFAAVLSSCSLKEDRYPCPCYLNVSFEEKESLRDTVSLLGWNSAELFSDAILAGDYDPYWVKAVRKGIFNFSVSRGAAPSDRNGHFIEAKFGSQSDSLYAFHDEIVAEGDMVYSKVRFHKQFCTVFLDIMKNGEQMKDFGFLVTGNTCGFDLLDFSPVSGPFSYDFRGIYGERTVSFRIPRQIDESMVLTIYRYDSEGVPEHMGNFPLGKYIVKTGYDWSEVDLQDVYVTVDLAIGQVIIAVDGWEDGMVFFYIEQ